MRRIFVKIVTLEIWTGIEHSEYSWQQYSALIELCHMAAPPLGHYAPLSFVVIGKCQRFEVGGQRSEVRSQRAASRT